MTTQFRHVDTRKPDGFYVQFAMVTPMDDSGDTPEERNDGFWPSQDKDAAGYCGLTGVAFEEAWQAAADCLEAWRRGDWYYVGVQAEARCLLVRDGHGTYYEFRSAGVWGIESDADDYLKEVYEEQKAELLADIALMKNPIIEA